MKYRYYLKEGDEIKTVDSDFLPEEFDKKDRPRLTLAMLAAGFSEEMFERSKNFLINQDFLIRVPIFTAENGKEFEGQNDEYRFIERKNSCFYGMRPSQSAEILHDAIIDGFDISTSGGSGFSQNNRFFFEDIQRSPEKFIGKQKPRIFAFSNVSNSTILQDFFDYVHSVPLTLLPGASVEGSIVEAKQQADQTLAIMRGESVELKRQAIAINEGARDLIEKADIYDIKIRSYPLNLGTFFHNQYNSDFAFTPPEEDYSLMLEGIITHDLQKTPKTVDAVRKFLEALQIRGQKLPLMIETGDFTPEEMLYDYDYVDGRVTLKPEHVRKLSQEEYYSLQKKQHDRSKAYDLEIQKICEEFGIAFFTGGETRIGHAKNQVQPSNSICRIKRNGYFLEIESEVRPRTLITVEDVERIATRKGLEKFAIKDPAVDKTDCQMKFELEQVNEKCEEVFDLNEVKSINLSSALTSDLHFVDDGAIKCFVIARKGLVSLFTKALEPALLSGNLHQDDQSPLVIALSADLAKATSEDLEQVQIKAKKMIQAFCFEHEVTRPIYLAKNFLDLKNGPELEPLKNGEVAKYGVEIKMTKDLKAKPLGVVEGGASGVDRVIGFKNAKDK